MKRYHLDQFHGSYKRQMFCLIHGMIREVTGLEGFRQVDNPNPMLLFTDIYSKPDYSFVMFSDAAVIL